MRYWLALMLIGACCSTAQARSYEPLALSGDVRTVREDAKPVLPGIRPVEVELLEDALRRKMPRTIGNSRELAHQKIIRNAARNPVKRAHIKGVLAEAMWLERNPQWGYVQSPTASQHDVYTWRAGRNFPYTAQIKTHGVSNPEVYARDMVSDHRSNLFLIPDDHVVPLRSHLESQMNAQHAAGNIKQAEAIQRQRQRIRGLGFTSKQLDTSYTRIARYAWREQHSGYISLGAVGAMALGPVIWDVLNGKDVSVEPLQNTAHAGALIGAERLVNHTLKRNSRTISYQAKAKPANSFIKGSIRGNALIGVAVLSVGTGISLYQNGSVQQTINNPVFYSNLGGSVSALTVGGMVGMSVGSGTAAITKNPLASGVTGTLAAITAGGLAYAGGQYATRSILYSLDPDLMRKEEKELIKTARESMELRLSQLVG